MVSVCLPCYFAQVTTIPAVTACQPTAALGNRLPVECHAANTSGPTLPHDAGIRGSVCRRYGPTLQQVGDAEREPVTVTLAFDT